MKSTKIFRILTLCILILFGLIIIFFFSEQSGTISNGFSTKVARYLANSWNDMFSQNMTQEQLDFLAKALNGPLRKLAHVAEYALLGFLSYGGLQYVYGRKVKGLGIFLMIMLIIGAAMVDEFNQFYSGGRGASKRDVMIDAIGGILGMYAFVILSDLVCRCKEILLHLKHPQQLEQSDQSKQRNIAN